MRHLTSGVVFTGLLVAVPLAQEGEPDPRPYLEAALQAARWLDSVAVESAGGRAWPADPARSTVPSWTLYQGTPGVVLFHLELASATGDERWTRSARRGADALLGWCDGRLDSSSPGLYTGSAGIGFALAETWRATLDERYLAGAVKILGHLRTTFEPELGSFGEGAVTDVIAGDAGVGFFLLYAARVLERPQELELAAATGHGLLRRAHVTEHGLDWAMSPTYERRMPNFSHGTAGVAAFLAALYGATGEESFLRGAAGGAEHLLSLDDPERQGFLVHHHSPGGEGLFYLGWCHGPPGSARLFRTLARVTGEERWSELERAAATTLLAAGLPDARPDGYWNNVGPCCGAAGVAAFLLDAHVRLEQEGALELARALTDDLVARGTTSAAGLSWEHAEHRVRPEYLSVQTGYMQGAAGIGIWLLRLDGFEQGREPVFQLPEDQEQ